MPYVCSDLDELWQVGIVAVHAVQTFDRDQHSPILATNFCQDFVQRFVIVVIERPPTGTGKLGTLNDAVVSKTVVDDQIAGPNQVPDHGLVGRMTAGEGNNILDTQELRQFGF
jgi:hypothetical protein